MARALKNPDAVPTYLDFFGMTGPPFSKLTGPTPVFHSEQYSLLMSHLACATEQTDCLIVIRGTDGSGKTTLLNRYIAGLGEDSCYAAFDETCADGTQFYLSFLKQLGFSDIAGKLRELRRITREFVIHRALSSDTVLVIIDNAHLVSPAVLEQLRWIAETKVEDRRVLSIVLAGNNDLPRIMESPAMRRLKFRSHIDFNIRVFTEEETEDYVRHRLRLAGGANAAKFSNEAHPLIYRFTGGIPNSINMLCNAVLTEACTRKTRVITEELIRAVADQHQLVPHVVPLQGKGRRKTDPDINVATPEQPEQETEERITAREAPTSASIPSPAGSLGSRQSDIDVESLLDKISKLSEQLGESKSAAKQARMVISARDKDISKLRAQLSARTAEIDKLSVAVGDNTGEIEQLNQALSDSVKALQDSENASSKLADDLKKEESAAKCAMQEAAKAKEKAEKQDNLKSELQSTVRQLKADLKLANKRAVEAERLEKNAAALKDEVKEQSAELMSRDEVIAELESSLQESWHECESLRSNADALKNQDDSETAKHIGELREQLAAQTRENQQLASSIDDNEEEIRRLSEALSDNEAALSENEQALADSEKALAEKELALADNETALSEKEQALADSEKAQKKSEDASSKLAAELLKSQRATKSAQADFAGANKRMEKLEDAKSELQESVSKLRADLRQAMKQSAKIDTLDKDTTALRDEIQDKANQLKSRDEMVADLEKSLQESRSQCETLQSSIDALQTLEDSLAERDARIADLEADLASYSSLETTTQPQLSDEAESDSKTSKPDAKAAQSGNPIATIEVFKDGDMEQVLNMSEFPSRIMIGRGDDSELRLDSRFVSRHHALIFCTDRGVYIEDLNSFNGTIVNSKKINRCDLRPDDTIIVGDYKLRPRRT